MMMIRLRLPAAGMAVGFRSFMSHHFNAVAPAPYTMVFHHLHPDGEPDDLDSERYGKQFPLHDGTKISTDAIADPQKIVNILPIFSP